MARKHPEQRLGSRNPGRVIVIGRVLERLASQGLGASFVAQSESDRPAVDEDATGPTVIEQGIRGASEMALRPHQVTTASVDEPDAMLDGTFARGVALRLPRFVVPEGADVVAHQGQQIAERLVDGGSIRVTERERGFVVFARLWVGVDSACQLAGAKVGARRVGGTTGQRRMRCDERPARGVSKPGSRARQRVSDSAVQQAAAREAGVLVGDVAQPPVCEVVADLARHRPSVPHG